MKWGFADAVKGLMAEHTKLQGVGSLVRCEKRAVYIFWVAEE
jgi:hypothetical protein